MLPASVGKAFSETVVAGAPLSLVLGLVFAAIVMWGGPT